MEKENRNAYLHVRQPERLLQWKTRTRGSAAALDLVGIVSRPEDLHADRRAQKRTSRQETNCEKVAMDSLKDKKIAHVSGNIKMDR